MKFALASRIFAEQDLQYLANQAKLVGVSGIELDVLPQDPAARRVFEAAGIEVAALTHSMAMPSNRRQRAAADLALRGLIHSAVDLNCTRLVLSIAQPVSRLPDSTVAARLAKWLLPHAAQAAANGVMLFIDNSPPFQTSRGMWLLLELANDPAIAACWDLGLAGESPHISVPGLNSRIQYARVRGSLGSAQTHDFITRLAGIGFAGFFAIEAPAEELAGAMKQLERWTSPPLPDKHSHVKKPALVK